MLSADDVRARAIAEGFVAARICRPDAIPDAAGHLADFVERGRHGQMGWMADRMAWRGDPAALWPEARSVVMCAESYSPTHDPLAILGTPDRGAISVYAQGRDYHDVVKKRLKRVARWMVEEGRDGQSVAPREAADAAHGGGAPGAPSRGSARSVAPVGVKVFVDTAPVMEKPLGQASGLGWQGKHTNLVGRELGSWFFLGAIFTTLDLAPDAGEVDHCGSCRKCLDICPTDAFPAPYQLDARRCISYLTIEHKGPVDPTLREGLGNRIYGCDDCLAVCPWNKFAVAARDQRLSAQEALIAPPLQMLAGLDDAAFREMFSGSPIKRIGRDRFVRNVAYAIGNSEDPALRPVAQELAGDSDAVVAEAGVWAANRLKS